ncbi:MAG: zf-HC2 domain-containing protein [Phycisphaerales bacterium]
MNCEQVRERLVEVQEGLLAEDDAPEILAHLESCDSCRAELNRVASLHSRLVTLAAEGGTVNSNDEGAATIVGELTMLRIGSRRPGSKAAAGAGRVLRWALPLAAAASLILVLSLNFIWPQHASAITLAQMTENVRKAGSMAFNVKMAMSDMDDLPALDARVTVQGGKRFRAEQNNPFVKGGRSVMIGDAETGATLILEPGTKEARRSVRKDGLDLSNTYQWMIDLGKQNGTAIGEETIRGEATRIVRADAAAAFGGQGVRGLPPGSTVDQRVWISIASRLPVRIEIKITAPMEGKTSTFVMTYSDFQFDAEYDPSFFSMDVPAGYHVEGEAMEAGAALELAKKRIDLLAKASQAFRAEFSRWPSNVWQMSPMLILGGDRDTMYDPRVAGPKVEFLYFRPVDGMLSDEGVIFEPGREGDAWPGSGLVGYLDGRVEEVTDRVRYQAMLQRARERAKQAK